jgi:hypothetical protein
MEAVLIWYSLVKQLMNVILLNVLLMKDVYKLILVINANMTTNVTLTVVILTLDVSQNLWIVRTTMHVLLILAFVMKDVIMNKEIAIMEISVFLTAVITTQDVNMKLYQLTTEMLVLMIVVLLREE